jgi:hypothetical protein
MNADDVPNGPTPHGGTYENTPWRVAAQFPGAKQLGIAKAFLENYHWWEFEPHQDWIDPAGLAFDEDFEEWFDAREVLKERIEKASSKVRKNELFAESRPPRKPAYAAGIPRVVRFVYIPNREYDWSVPRVINLESDVLYTALFFNPATGETTDLGFLPMGATEWEPPVKPTCRDYVLVLACYDQDILRIQMQLASLMKQ